jgi:hypothetical protein
MERVRFIQHNGKEILFLDFSQCKPDDVPAIIEQSKAVIRKKPENSLLTLTDVTDTRFNDTVTHQMKEFTAHNKPYIRASAVVGITGLKKILFEAVMAFSKRKLHAFDTIEQAKAWLVSN